MKRLLAPLLLTACAGPGPGASVPPHAPIPVAPMGESAGVLPARRPIDSKGESAGVLPARRPIDTVTPAPAPGPSPQEPHARRECPEDMAAVASFCIDRYEAPNAKGEFPVALQTAYDGEAWCAARGKRLCTEDEWVRACEGASGRRFPYGDEHRRGACNDDHQWVAVQWKVLARWPAPEAVEEARRLYQADPSGSRAQCVSEEGVYDLTGNVAEWVRRSDPAPRPGYDHVLKGCYWAGCYHEPQPNCTFANHAHPGSFRTYEAGFRCCRDRLAQ